ncbi:MAG TPA: cell wall hydrolase [Sphingobium sp.]|nr:cell wall hydrolase [Sphingobium sp.]
MFKSFRVASAAAFGLVGVSFLLAYGVTTAASAQVQSFEAPVMVAPAVATAVEPTSSEDFSGDDAPDSLAELVAAWKADGPLDAESRCLATAVFFEARSESLEGQLAVANVVIGRARSGRFADSLCGVVTQKGQFGFVRGGRMPEVPTSRPAWRTAQAIAQIALEESWRNPAEGALFFHAAYSSPKWDRPLVARIGRHIFYR